MFRSFSLGYVFLLFCLAAWHQSYRCFSSGLVSIPVEKKCEKRRYLMDIYSAFPPWPAPVDTCIKVEDVYLWAAERARKPISIQIRNYLDTKRFRCKFFLLLLPWAPNRFSLQSSILCLVYTFSNRKIQGVSVRKSVESARHLSCFSPFFFLFLFIIFSSSILYPHSLYMQFCRCINYISTSTRRRGLPWLLFFRHTLLVAYNY